MKTSNDLKYKNVKNIQSVKSKLSTFAPSSHKTNIFTEPIRLSIAYSHLRVGDHHIRITAINKFSES